MSHETNKSNRSRNWILTLLAVGLVASPARGGLNRWTTNGPGGIFRGTMAADPSNPQHLVVGASFGVYISTDSGGTWIRYAHGLESTVILSVAIDPHDSSILYAAAGDGLFRSVDGGANWDWRGDGIGDIFMDVLVVDPVDSSILYVGTAAGFFKSVDSGCHWSMMNSGLTSAIGPPLYVDALAIDPANPLTLYVGIFTGGLFKSTDGGVSWQPKNNGIPFDTVTGITIDPTNSNRMFVAASSGGGDLGPFTSGFVETDDAGDHWHNVFTNLPTGSAQDITVDPTSATTLYASIVGPGFFKSTNNGQTWSPINVGIPNSHGGKEDFYKTKIIVNPVDPRTLLGVNAGLYRSSDAGASWDDLNGSIVADGQQSVFIDPSNSSTLYGAGMRGISRSDDNGQNWTLISTDPMTPFGPVLVAAAPTNPTTLFATSFFFGLYRSSDSGVHWQQLYEDGSSVPFPFTIKVIVDPGNARHLYTVATDGIYESTDGGDHWAAPLPNASNGGFTDLIVQWGSPNIFFGTDGASIFESPDAGQTWNDISSGISPANPIHIVQDPNDSSQLFAGTTASGVYLKAGASAWAAIGTGLPGSYITGLVLDPATPGTIYAGLSAQGFSQSPNSGVFVSHDSGQTWARFGLPLGQDNRSSLAVSFLALSPLGDHLHAASLGVYDYEISPTPSPAISGIAPESGPIAGGTPFVITGTGFAPGAQVLIGGSAAGGITVPGPTTIEGTTPQGGAGGADVVVINLDTQRSTLRGRYAYDFLDVPVGAQLHDEISSVARAGITQGCGSGDFCPLRGTTRAEMAAFLERAIHGADFLFPPPTPIFLDVDACTPLSPFISQLSVDGLTMGCGGGDFCPNDIVSRAQSAAFLARFLAGGDDLIPTTGTIGGQTYDCTSGPDGASFFLDVAPDDLFCKHIHYIATKGITLGCGANSFCPTNPTLREQAAAFIARAFSLP